MNKLDNNTRPGARLFQLLKRAKLQALLFAGGSLGTTLLTLGMLGEIKMPRAQAE